MYSKTSRFFTLLGCMALFSLGCGHKGPPLPPPLQNPTVTTDLRIQQRGSELIVTFGYPQTTMSGELLTELDSVEYWELVRPVPEWAKPGSTEESDETEGEADEEGADEGDEPMEKPMAEPMGEPDDLAGEAKAEEGDKPEMEEEEEEADEEDLPPVLEPTKEELVAVEPLEFEATAKLRLTLTGAELQSAIAGDTISMRFPLDPDTDTDTEEEIGHIFAVKTFAGPRLASPFSNLATLVRRVPPPAPAGFSVEAQTSGIRVSWDNEKAEVAEGEEAMAEDAMAETEEEDLVAFHVYRRDAQSRNYDRPLIVLPPTAEHHTDTTAQYGNRYIYSITAVAENPPLIESAFAGEREIDYQDRFAPSPPINLVALAEPNRVRLLWDASRAKDLAGYVVFRRQGDGEFLRLNAEVLTDPEYSDLSVLGGTTYDYRVAAIDQLGNLSDPGQPVTARVP